jgi:hypothetical protein
MWKSRNRKSTVDKIQSFVGQSRQPRNARLALLDYLAKIPSTGQSAPRPSDLLSACKHYFETFATKTCCFDDARCYIETLGPGERKEYLEHIRQFTEQMVNDDPSDEVSAANPLLRTACLYDLLETQSSLDCDIDQYLEV